MSKVVDEVMAANASYVADFGDKGSLPMPPGRQFAILTCMDATSMTTSMASGDSASGTMAATRGAAQTVTAPGPGSISAARGGSSNARR